jgi:hypothetical protein
MRKLPLLQIGFFGWVGIVAIIAAKYLIPVLLVPFPFAAGWANFVLDTVDGDLLIPLGLEDATYQPIDKAADYVTYIFMVVAAWKGSWPIFKWIVGFFALRTIGQLLFFITNNEAVFFYFPNFLEPLFLIYATILFFKKDEAPAVFTKWQIPIAVFIFLYKMQDEYITHIGNFDRSDLIRDLFS